MGLTQDRSSEHVAHVYSEIGLFREIKIGLHDSVNVTKCLQQLEIHDLLHMCA